MATRHPIPPTPTRRATHVITVINDDSRHVLLFLYEWRQRHYATSPPAGGGPTHLERGAYAPLVEDAP